MVGEMTVTFWLRKDHDRECANNDRTILMPTNIELFGDLAFKIYTVLACYAGCGHFVSALRLGKSEKPLIFYICGITFFTTQIHHMLLTISYSESVYPITPV